MEADLMRVGLRLRWLGDGTGRLTIRDLWALVNSSIGDETSALFRARGPGLSLAERVGIDQLNALWLVQFRLRQLGGDRSARKFQPIRSYPGSPFDPEPRPPLIDMSGALGGYKPGTRSEITQWLASLGLPTPRS